jgi:hypothetical protein
MVAGATGRAHQCAGLARPGRADQACGRLVWTCADRASGPTGGAALAIAHPDDGAAKPFRPPPHRRRDDFGPGCGSD